MTNTVLAWHFTKGEKLRDGRPLPPNGKWLTHREPVVIGKSGFHGSRKLLDALNYAPGTMLSRVEHRGDIQEQSDKLVSRERRILWRFEADSLLRKFACEQALSVAHLWNMPSIVRLYLETQEERFRAAALDAAGTAAWYAARAAARAAAGDAAGTAAWAAAWAAARAAAGDAAWDAARAAAWAAANAKLEDMVFTEQTILVTLCNQ